MGTNKIARYENLLLEGRSMGNRQWSIGNIVRDFECLADYI